MSRDFISDIRGMTLLDMAVALLVISFLMGPVLYTYNRWKLDEIKTITRKNVETNLRTALEEFYFLEGRYPCPSDITLSPADPEYGKEVCPNPDTVAATPVLQGGVPFATLKLPNSAALDGWSNRIYYAVTQAQANPNIPGNIPDFNFPANGGQIKTSGYMQFNDPITDIKVCEYKLEDLPSVEQAKYPNYPDGTYGDPANNNFPANGPRGAHYLFLSYGEQGIGARNASGQLIEACPADGTTAETQNCDGDNEFWHNMCVGNTIGSGNAEYFDDFMFVTNNPPGDVWMPGAQDENDTITSDQFVGIGTPTPEYTLDVMGNIKVEQTGEEGKNGRIHSDQLCSNTNTTNCFSPSLIAGNDPNMKCATDGTAMKGVSYKKANCAVTYIPQRQSTCGANLLVTGINAAGQVTCSPP